MPRPVPALLSLATAFAASGCCSLARFFCGPDTTPWVSQRFDTPHDAVATFLEAMGRDNADVVYLCLAEDYKRQLGITDHLAANVAWRMLQDETPGLHMARYAKVGDPELVADHGARFLLDVEGRKLQVELVRQTYWEVHYLKPPRVRDGVQDPGPRELGENGGIVPSLLPYCTIVRETPRQPKDDEEQMEPNRSTLTTRLTFHHGNLEQVPLEDVTRAGVGREWKIAGLRFLEPE